MGKEEKQTDATLLNQNEGNPEGANASRPTTMAVVVNIYDHINGAGVWVPPQRLSWPAPL